MWVKNRSGLKVNTIEYDKTDFYEAMHLAFNCCDPTPSSYVRIYHSKDTDLWFVGMFDSATTAARVSGSGHTLEQAISTLNDTCAAYMDRKAAIKAGELPVDPKFRRALAGNVEARTELTQLLAGLL